jgi:aminopeptidase N
MKLLFTLAAALIVQGLSAQSNAPLTQFDVLDYQYRVWVTDTSDTVTIEAVIELKTLKQVSALAFDLASADAATGKGMEIQQTESSFGAAIFEHQNNQFTITAAVDSGMKGTITVLYKGIPADGLVIGKNKFGHRTFFGDNWPNRAHQWLACVDHPADKATVHWTVVAPAQYTVLANGIETGEYLLSDNRKRWTFSETHPIPMKVAVIGIAQLQKQLAGDGDCLLVYNYVYPETNTRGLQKMAVAKDIVAFYSRLLGDYPYQKLANVQSTTMFGGMENANTIFYDEERIDNSSSIESLMAHEIAHQWFGNTVTEKDFSHLWLSEGFATFLTNYWLEQKYGTGMLNKRLADDRKKVKTFLASHKRPVVDSVADYMSLLNANSYEKGGLFLQALRQKTGTYIFFRILRSYFKRYKYKNASTDDFRAVVEEITGSNWQAYFNEWLYTAQLPAE